MLAVPARTKFKYGFSATVEKILALEAEGYKRRDIEPIVKLHRGQIAKSVRLYLTSMGETPDSGHLEIRNFAADLVKKLDADEISLHNADAFLIEKIKGVSGKDKTTYRRAATAANPEQQRATYSRAVLALEGICLALDKMPDVVHSSITTEERQEFVERLAGCRRIIERRINIIRRDTNNG